MEGKYSHFGEIDKEELREIASRGGVKSGEVRRQKRTMREQMEALLSSPAALYELQAKMDSLGLPEGGRDNMAGLACVLFLKAIECDYSAVDRVLELIGEGGTQRISIKSEPSELGNILNQLGENDGKD